MEIVHSNDQIRKPEKGTRLDHYWRDIFQLQTATGNPRYPLLTRIVKAALVLPHGRMLTAERKKLAEETINGLCNTKGMVKFSDPQSHRPERVPVTKKLLSSVRSAQAAYRPKCEKDIEENERRRREKEKEEAEIARRQKEMDALKAKNASLLEKETTVSVYFLCTLVITVILDITFVRSVVLVPEEAEDMWHAYNLIAVGDHLKSTTIRRVQNESMTGSVSSSKVRTTLTIAVEGIEFDTQACMLRIKGRNVEENQYVKMGAYHTIDLELNRKFTLIKEYWDVIALERVEMACDPTQHADLGAVLLHEGLGHIILVTSSMTVVRAKIDMNVPRKRKGFCSQHDKGLLKFYDALIQGILRHINFDGKFVHSSSGHKHALKEVLADPTVTARLAETKVNK
ncbi:PREDICTED: protein pelota homolog [Acropora digitifera]|uniref:protein pelota homolog n=1 Tax=Acropora digitifera TaxID=70779 RepID=UPI00077A69C9|nr:PREDICTED: protein pelota homolog [Acropora digitifera]